MLSESTEKLPLEVGFSHPHHFRPNVCSLQSEDRLAFQHCSGEEKKTVKWPKSLKKNNKATEPLRTAPRKNYLTISNRCHFCFPHNKKLSPAGRKRQKSSTTSTSQVCSAIPNLTVSFLDNFEASPQLGDHFTLTELQLTVLEAFPVSFCEVF